MSGLWTYEVVIRDVHPTKPAIEHRVKVVAPSAAAARRVAAGLGAAGWKVRGIVLQGTPAAVAAQRLAPWGER